MARQPRLAFYEYWDVSQLPVGEMPFSAVNKALKDERYLRKFKPTFYRENLLQGHLSALLYWYPSYIDLLFKMAIDGDYGAFFKPFPFEIFEGFKYLFPEVCEMLDNILENKIRSNHLDETKFNKKFK